MFEYSEANQVIQKITVPANSFNYLIWRYQYNAQGLKTREAIYSKELTEQTKGNNWEGSITSTFSAPA